MAKKTANKGEQKKATMKIIVNRHNPIWSKRMKQLDLNRLAFHGGRDYVESRLWRAPNETDTQWFGDAEEQIVGRKERSCLINDAGRIANKIRQYIFKKPIEREGIDEEFRLNCAGEGVSIDDFMGSVCDSLTTGQWCWIQVDTTPIKLKDDGTPEAQTLENKAKVYWRLWDSCAIPDWSIDPDGKIRWVIVRTKIYQNSNPFIEGKFIDLSTLFYLSPEDGKVHVWEETNEKVNFELRKDVILEDLDRIPFILIGNPSTKGWWFDDVENLQAQVMNYDSMHNETLTDAVYPQLVVPMSLLNTLETDLSLDKVGAKKLITLQRELIKGRKNPFYEQAEDKGITRYIQPASGDLKMITDEQDRKRKLLFDMCGLALFNRETRQVQTAESKSFDQLDTNATLGNRALILQRAEKLAVELSKYFDPQFQIWEPVYNQKFDVIDVQAMSQTIATLTQLPNTTPTMQRVMLECAVKIVMEVGGIDEETYNKALEEIQNLSDEELMPKNPFSDRFEEDEFERDENGEIVLDENGEPVMKPKPQLPFMKKDGEEGDDEKGKGEPKPKIDPKTGKPVEDDEGEGDDDEGDEKKPVKSGGRKPPAKGGKKPPFLK